MNVIMSPLWAVDLLLLLAPAVIAIWVAGKRRRQGEPVEPTLVRGIFDPRSVGGWSVAFTSRMYVHAQS